MVEYVEEQEGADGIFGGAEKLDLFVGKHGGLLVDVEGEINRTHVRIIADNWKKCLSP